MKGWTFTDLDAQVAREFEGFLPAEIFDAHAHLYRVAELEAAPTSILAIGPAEVTAPIWRDYLGRQMGAERLRGGLFMAVPFAPAEMLPVRNRFVAEQVAAAPGSRWLAAISPSTAREEVAGYLGSPGFAGFKPYHVLSAEQPTFEAPLGSFLPAWAWELADEHGLIITIHLVKHGALADPENGRELRARCLAHPGAQVILAHAARGFHAPNTAAGLPALRGLENVWFDTAAICEPPALKAILLEFGPRRLLWGSDFPLSESRGKCVTAGDGFVWLEWESLPWESLSPACRPTLVGLEALLALKEAAEDIGLNDEDVRDIFAGNARRLLLLEEAPRSLTQELYRHAKQRIPGGTQLLSKRPEMLAPDQWPAYFREARGCETWDLDGRHFHDMSTSGIGACLLGFRDPDVTRAVRRRINLGSMCTLNSPDEVELADRLCEIHPWAEQVRYTRSGGEACAVAARIARATTDRSLIALCGYHGWHDWYLAANLGEEDALRGHLLPGLDPLGVPRELRGTTLTFTYNSREELQAILAAHGDRLAAVIMEPCRYRDPEPGFLEFVRDGAHRCGALLAFDEISIGFRLHLGGAHLRLGVAPDIAIFAKALGNGHPIGAVIGTAAAMEGAGASFISSSYWTDGVGPAAALATLAKMRTHDVPAHVARVGAQVRQLWQAHGDRHGLPVIVGDGYPCQARFRFDHPQAEALRTLYTQLMLARGFLAGVVFQATLAHTDDIVAGYGEAIDEVFGEIAAALAADNVLARLQGPIAHSGFRRLL